MKINILNKLRLSYKKIINNNSEYIFNTNKKKNNFSITFNKNILIDFSKNIINNNIINLLVKLFNKFNFLNLKNNNYLSYKEIFYLDTILINKINFLYNKLIYNSFNIIENIVNIGHLKYKYEFDFISNVLKEYKVNNYKFYYLSYLNSDIINIIKNFNLKKTIFIISYDTYEDYKLIEIINFIINRINLEIDNINNYINTNIIILTSLNLKNRIFNINTNNIIYINTNININTNSIYYISMILLIYLGNLNFNNFIKGIKNINNNFLYEKKIYNNISVLLSLIDIWYLIFFKFRINLMFLDYYLNNFINYYINLHLFYKNISFYKNIILGSSDIYIQNFLYKTLLNNKNLNCEFIFFCKNNNFLFEYNHNNFISESFYRSRSMFFINNNINNIKNFLFNKKRKNYEFNNNINIIPNNFILLNKLNPNNLGILIYIYKYRIFLKNILISNIKNEKLNFNYLDNIIDILDIKLENQETNYDTSTNELINFYKKNRYI
ncbi:hypothetical protein [endosymbiont of Pachyrhynchus infernalis]|uniref:hypothetical protein n=1 Tax=endosymbiont of Pachyrhynchus infernalis TaxID=1971488 RepID=UPI000DC6F323|nr:hypothetical protein [endosymbiont of Pachyrhynchus infernalis]BBA84769.1 glucose-6-phosphate isomerase [endosymbiont of Pachyrhynchus infernalis]